VTAAPRGTAVRPVIVVHAGAGSLGSSAQRDAQQSREWLERALAAAGAMLAGRCDALTAATAAVEVMEDCPLFNAGHGSALCADGSVRMSAALMRGFDRAAGAVADVRTTRHPIVAALAVLQRREVFVIGEEADRLAREAGAEQWAGERFVTERQQARLAARRRDDARGTVGAVCLDADGGLAAATSTGGMTGQSAGRVGDSPLIGAGTWADARVGVSCTGDGEAFIRAAAAHRVAALHGGGMRLQDAAHLALDDVRDLGGRGGMIALDAAGTATMPFTTQAMPRGMWRRGEEPVVSVLD
jgi:beta-aspartyl-peptidase (threonine type)